MVVVVVGRVALGESAVGTAACIGADWKVADRMVDIHQSEIEIFLVVSDLHHGDLAHLEHRGVSVPSVSANHLVSQIFRR